MVCTGTGRHNMHDIYYVTFREKYDQIFLLEKYTATINVLDAILNISDLLLHVVKFKQCWILS